MRLAHYFIDRPRFAAVVNIFIVLAGLATVLLLPVAQYPNIVPPNIDIVTSFPGASAETVARTVATPIEQAVNGVEGMDYITSQSTGDGRLTTTVVFKVGVDPNNALLLTRNRVQDVLSRLPPEVQQQGVQVNKTIKALLLGIHIYSPDGSRSVEYLSNFMLKLKDEVARIPGVSQFWSLGERQYSMRVWVDPDKAAAYNISAKEILAALRAQNAQVAAGGLNRPPHAGQAAYEINIETQGRLETPEQFGNIVIKSDAEGRVTRVRDIGRVEVGSADYGSKAYTDREPSSPSWVIATPDANVIAVQQAVWSKLEELRPSFPSGVDYMRVYDPTNFVIQSIEEVIVTIFVAILLVVGVVYLFLQSWRATLIPVIAIPISLIGTISFLAITGTSINNLSLFGLVLAVGIVVDDAIVVVENVERNMALGLSPREAARRTMSEVSKALVAIALTLCAVFVPTAFISGISGIFFKQFAITVAASTIISCFVSLTLSPAMCAMFLKPHKKGDIHEEPRGLTRFLHPFFRRFNAMFERMSASYGQLTSRFVRATGMMLIIYAGLVGLTTFQMSRMSTGFIPDTDIGYLATVVMLPPGSSLERTDEVIRQVNEIALSTPGVEHTSPIAGFDITSYTIAPNIGTVFSALPSLYRKHIPGVNAATMVKTLQAKFDAQIKDAVVVTIMPPTVQGLGNAGGFKAMLEDRAGLGPEALAKAANDLAAAANKDGSFAGVFTLFNAGAPSLYADVDRLKAEKLGVSPDDVFATMQLYLGSQYVNDFNLAGRTYPVLVQGDQQFRLSAEDIGRLKVRNAAGDMVPLGAVATFKNQTRPYRVPRYNLFPAAEILGAAGPGVASGTAMKRLEELAEQTLPNGIELEWTDIARQEKQQGIPTILIFAASALFVFLVLTAQYESWKIPLAILLIIPTCLFAASSGLHLRSMPIDILAQVGFVVLLGLAAKNAILIVEFAKHHQDHEGVGAEEAATLSARERLRPILMTSLAFIAGVFPLVIAHGAGSEMRQSLGTTVFFGMLGVTIFGLVFTPAFYAAVQKLRLRRTPGGAPSHDFAPLGDRNSA